MRSLLAAGLVVVAAELIGCFVPLPHGAFMVIIPTGAIRELAKASAADAGASGGTLDSEQSAESPDAKKGHRE